MAEISTPPRTYQRSPSYPPYDLETSVARAKDLHDIAGSNRVHVSTALKAWGVSPKSSRGPLTIGSLKKFGLAEDQGKRAARELFLTKLGQELVVYEDDQDVWAAAARMAAMIPAIHRELWTNYRGDLPADSVIEGYLVLTRGFAKATAQELVREFRRTLDFARIEPGELFDFGDEGDEPIMTDDHSELAPSALSTLPPATSSARLRTSPKVDGAPLPVNVNLSDNGWATLQISSRLTEVQWKQLMAVLDAMKPGLTT